MSTNIRPNITTGNINKQNWSGETAEVRGEHADGRIRFLLNDYEWTLTWVDDSANRDADLIRLIGSGYWELRGEGFTPAVMTTFADENPVHALTAAARWIWNFV